jgi:hypothetical protein
MAITINVNGVAISYPQTGDPEWGDDATEFAIQVAGALAKIGQSTSPATNNITIPSGNLTVTTGNTDLGGTLDVTGATNLDSTLDVTGATNLDSTLDVTGATNLDSTLDVTGVTTIVDDLIVDTDTLFVDVSTDRVGINTATPTVALDVVGDIKSSAGITGSSATLTNLTVDTNLIITNSTDNRVGINTTSPQEALDVTGKVLVSSDITIGGVIVADDSTNVTTTPPITFTGDTDTGIGRSAADTLDFVTGGQPRFRIEPTGQIKAVYESTLGTDYNTQLDNGYLCRAWVNFNGTLTTLSGTYTISGTTITVSITSHGLSTGNFAQLDFSSGDGVDGRYSVTVINANSYTITNPVSGSTGGSVRQDGMIRSSGNVSSITDNGAGDYTVNFTNSMPDANYSVIGASKRDNTQPGSFCIRGTVYSISSVQVGTTNDAATFLDNEIVCVGVFR